MSNAQIEERYSRLATDFGEELARKWFGDDVVDSLPRYKKGEKAGQIKGWLKWNKCVSGGWVYRGRVDNTGVFAGGNVARPNEIRNKMIEVDFNPVWLITCEPDQDVSMHSEGGGDIDSHIASKKDDLEKSKLQLEWVQNATDEDDIKFHKTVDSEKFIKRDIAQYTNELELLEYKKRYGGLRHKVVSND